MKAKVSLSADKSLGYGHLLYCCGKRQQVEIDTLENGDVWKCVSCEKPLLLKWEDEFYEIGNLVTI